MNPYELLGLERVSDMRSCVVGASRHSNWLFIELETNSGLKGLGEATLDGLEGPVSRLVSDLAVRLRGLPIQDLPEWCRSHVPGQRRSGLIGPSIRSALDQAVWDLAGKSAKVPVSALLGGPSEGWVPVYANINRALDDRDPETFSAAAEAAIHAGFKTVKCAPFDGVTVRTDERQLVELVDRAVRRVRAIRETVGSHIEILIDLHWRFSPDTAPLAIRALAPFNPGWIEAPIDERNPVAWASSRAATPGRLAGGELLVDSVEFDRFMNESRVDVVMPDVKYCGGVSGLVEVARLARRHNVFVAPHGPSGPVSVAAALHVASATSNTLMVEYAFGEADWRSCMSASEEEILDGRMRYGGHPGLGVSLDQSIVAQHGGRSTLPTLGEDFF